MHDHEIKFWHARSKNLRMLAHLVRTNRGDDQKMLIYEALKGHPGNATVSPQYTTTVYNALQYAHNMNEAALGNLADKCAELANAVKKLGQTLNHDDLREWIIQSLKQGGKAVHAWTPLRTKAPPLPATMYDEDSQTHIVEPQAPGTRFGDIAPKSYI